MIRIKFCRNVSIAGISVTELVECLMPKLMLGLWEALAAPRAKAHERGTVTVVSDRNTILVPTRNPIDDTIATLVWRLDRVCDGECHVQAAVLRRINPTADAVLAFLVIGPLHEMHSFA